MKYKKGFSLIELALVLVIIGIILSIGLIAFKILIQQSKFKETKAIVQTACDTVVAYAEKNYTLPDANQFQTLGVRTTDAYGKNLVYAPAPQLTANNICTYENPSLLSLNIYSSCSGTPTTKNIAFIVYSTGENRLDQTASGGTYSIYPANCEVNGEIYDDIVCFYDLETIKSKVCPPPLRIDTSDLPPTAYEDSYYEGTVKLSGGFPPYNLSATSLPCGLTLSGNRISGVVNCNPASSNGVLPGCSQTHTITLEASDTPSVPPPNSTSVDFTLTVEAQHPKILEDSLPQAQEGVPYNVVLHATGGDGNYVWNISGLPDGLTASGNTISGTPETGTAGTYEITITVSSCGKTFTKVLPLVVNPVISSGSNNNTTCPAFYLNPSSSSYTTPANQQFSLTITPTGGQAPYQPINCQPSSCNGLTLTCTSSQATISGVPTGTGSCTFSVAYQDSCTPTPQTATGTYTINISCPALSLSANLPPANICELYNGSISATGTTPFSWSYSGDLPYNLQFCNTTGNICSITGTVNDTVGDHTFVVSVSDGCGQSISDTFSITVSGLDMTGITGTDCSTTGIELDEDVRRWLYLLTNQGCVRITRRDSTYITPGGAFSIYTDSGCTRKACDVEFCQLWSVEKANGQSDCKVSIINYDGTTCTFIDKGN